MQKITIYMQKMHQRAKIIAKTVLPNSYKEKTFFKNILLNHDNFA